MKFPSKQFAFRERGTYERLMSSRDRGFVLRFAVGSPSANRSSTWRVWVPAGQSDVYLSQRGLGGAFKASLHASGECRFAFTKNFVLQQQSIDNWSRPDRLLDTWARPAIAPGFFLPCRVAIPSSELRPFTTWIDPRRPVTWMPEPPLGNHVAIDLLIVEPQLPQDQWPGKNSMGTILLRRHTLSDSTTLFIVYSNWLSQPSFQKGIHDFHDSLQRPSRAWVALDPPSGEGTYRGILMGRDGENNSRYFVEVALDDPPNMLAGKQDPSAGSISL